jgi:hypothetical protein
MERHAEVQPGFPPQNVVGCEPLTLYHSTGEHHEMIANPVKVRAGHQ